MPQRRRVVWGLCSLWSEEALPVLYGFTTKNGWVTRYMIPRMEMGECWYWALRRNGVQTYCSLPKGYRYEFMAMEPRRV